MKAKPCFSQPSYPSVLAKASPATALSVSTDYKALPQCAIVAAWDSAPWCLDFQYAAFVARWKSSTIPIIAPKAIGESNPKWDSYRNERYRIP
ncbi:hypothetical protein [Paenibacillus typhae]|uniref:hypothetical protein n=1 Tax=Paenibacillus typhae TaxID=1174501 RepID=UPI001C8ED37C|nr:hypothetical protein [Paenibacillus typhae]MBY0011642.1 hypothetical protein [Paenibacillus typhae]